MINLSGHLKKHGYSIIGLIGTGGYGKCYTVSSVKYKNITFVCKIMESSSKIEASFAYKSEIEALLTIWDNSVVQVYDFFQEGTSYYIILEHCSNGSIDKFISEGVLFDENVIFKYGRGIISALNGFHQAGFAHHDIKPSNILLDTYNRAKLTDFGLAKKYSTGQLSTAYKSTIYYISPEMAMEKPFDPFKADIWALGITFYEMATGRFPFNGATEEAIKKAIIAGNFIMPSNVSVKLANIINDCLCYDPLWRLSAKELYEKYFAMAIPLGKTLSSSPKDKQPNSLDHVNFREKRFKSELSLKMLNLKKPKY